jgi:putative transcriptional regulator
MPCTNQGLSSFDYRHGQEAGSLAVRMEIQVLCSRMEGANSLVYKSRALPSWQCYPRLKQAKAIYYLSVVFVSVDRLAKMQQILLALGKRLRELRAEQGFSQEAFADHCGLHRNAMSLIERGKRVPSLRTLVTLSQGFGMSLSELLEDVDRGIAKKRK